MKPRAAYLHVPFCRHRCGYCNFTVVAGRDDLATSYLDAIERELALLKTARPVRTLYFGGGTPTHLSDDSLARLLRLARHWFPPEEGERHSEWTVEANPADLQPETVELLASVGVTRLSLGAQSLRDEKLRLLERDHQAADVARAVEAAHGKGLEVSVDLIFAAPGETLAQWCEDLRAAIQLGAGHLSAYGLTYEKGTSFWSRLARRDLEEIDEELQRQMYLEAIDQLTAAGYTHYEISNYAQPSKESQHNHAYWAGEAYYAAGPGAARYVDGVRETNHRSTTTYLRRVLAGESPVAERETLSDEERAREQLVFGLRRLRGVDLDRFSQSTGYQTHDLAGEPIQKFIELGFLEQSDTTLRLTRDGLLVSDSLWPELL